MGAAWSTAKTKPSTPVNIETGSSDEFPPSYYLRDPSKKWIDTEKSDVSGNTVLIVDDSVASDKSPDDGNATSVEAISDRLGEVTHLAEQLDVALCGAQAGGASSSPVTPNIKQILDGTATTTPQDWYGSLKHPTHKSTPNTSSDSKSEDEFLTASECTCTPPSRSSSFQTASEGGAVSPWWEVEPNSDTDEKTKTLTKRSQASRVTRELTSEVTVREVGNQKTDKSEDNLASYALENSLRPDMTPVRTSQRESSDELSRTSEIVKQLSQIVQNNEETSRDIDTSSQYSSELLNPGASHTKSLSFDTDNTDLSLPRFSSAAPQVTKFNNVKKPAPNDDDAAYRKELQRFAVDDNAKIYIIDASTPSPKSQRYLETSFDLYDEPRELESRLAEVKRKPLTIDLQGACALPPPDYYCPATLKRMAIQGIF